MEIHQDKRPALNELENLAIDYIWDKDGEIKVGQGAKSWLLNAKTFADANFKSSLAVGHYIVRDPEDHVYKLTIWRKYEKKTPARWYGEHVSYLWQKLFDLDLVDISGKFIDDQIAAEPRAFLFVKELSPHNLAVLMKETQNLDKLAQHAERKPVKGEVVKDLVRSIGKPPVVEIPPLRPVPSIPPPPPPPPPVTMPAVAPSEMRDLVQQLQTPTASHREKISVLRTIKKNIAEEVVAEARKLSINAETYVDPREIYQQRKKEEAEKAAASEPVSE